MFVSIIYIPLPQDMKQVNWHTRKLLRLDKLPELDLSGCKRFWEESASPQHGEKVRVWWLCAGDDPGNDATEWQQLPTYMNVALETCISRYYKERQKRSIMHAERAALGKGLTPANEARYTDWLTKNTRKICYDTESKAEINPLSCTHARLLRCCVVADIKFGGANADIWLRWDFCL